MPARHKLEFQIAFRYLKAKKSHTAVNVIAVVAVVGIAVATAAMVLVLSIFNGFTDLALKQLSTLDPDLSVVSGQGKIIADADSVSDIISGIEGVTYAYPVITERGLIVGGEERIPVVFKGVPSGYDVMTGVDDIMIAGEYAEATSVGEPAVQLSVGVANGVRLYPGPESRLELLVPRRKGRINPANPSASFRGEDVVYSGVFRVNNTDVDQEYVLVPLSAARNLLDYESEATSIEVRVGDGANVNAVKSKIEKEIGDRYKVLDRIEQRSDSFRMISVEKWVTFMMLIFILVIALFNVVSTLSLLAIEKRDNMRTLGALGTPRSMLRNIFIAEGFLVTTIGGAIGIIAGVIVALIQQIFHVVKLSADVTSLAVESYPVRVEAGDIVVVAAVILAMSVIVGAISRAFVKS